MRVDKRWKGDDAIAAMAREFNVSRPAITDIVRGNSWKLLGGVWISLTSPRTWKR